MGQWYETIIAAHLSVTDAVSHSERMQSERYFVWQEDGQNALFADNAHAERVITGATDLYTKQEFDPWGEQLGETFTRYGVAWELSLLEYEEETGFYHWRWDWEVC